ncbi:hypothetical protein AUR64_02110 [Haloprofundus marisrubri]|uniref:Uncharacterized protein n=1 Tax=Haloprofundus marisrubri TaxID=1514971 RepID=A0A0W1R3G6_9EURY|nr:hypothetical protein [Haloprofundus marisrubri]KTG07798.1 hypothetical protein AUR64_02110 [Haloprofundus marisrubri]
MSKAHTDGGNGRRLTATQDALIRRELGITIEIEGEELGDELAMLGSKVSSDELTAADVIQAHRKTSEFFELHGEVLGLYADDMNAEAAELMEMVVRISGFATHAADALTRESEQSDQRLDGLRSALEQTLQQLDELEAEQ